MSFWPKIKENPVISVLLTIVLILLSFLLLAMTIRAFAETDQIQQSVVSDKTITVDGSGTGKTGPDIAIIRVGVETSAETTEEAQSQNSSKMNAMLDAFKELGIESEDLQTERYNIYEDEYYDREVNEYVSRGWIVNQSVTVTIRDTELVGDVLEIAGSGGATDVYGPNFEIDDPTVQLQDARVEAIEDAMDQAEEIADALGVKLGDIVDYQEWQDGGYYPQPYYSSFDSTASAEEVAIEPGLEEVTMNVSITFELK